MGRAWKLNHSAPEPSSRRHRRERVPAAEERMNECEKPSISPKPGRKKYTGRAKGKCANPRVRRWFLMDWIQEIVPVDLTDFAGRLARKSNPAPFPRRPRGMT